jgi:hypothetical protein
MGEAKRVMGAKRVMEEAIDGLLKENVEAQAAFKAIRDRGCDEQFARDEIGRALLACLWEVWNKKTAETDTQRLKDVLRLLENGQTTAEIWPHDLEEVATAMEQMFKTSASMGEKEPDTDMILDILDEHFPGITMEQLTDASAIFRARLIARSTQSG